eukprot:3649701-Pyramimonas_sp.AAC.1
MPRLRWYQCWAKYPEEHGAAQAAASCTSKLNASLAVLRMEERDWIGQASTPWAKQLFEDMGALA